MAAKFRADDEDSRKTLNLPGMSQDIVMLENEDGSVAMELLYYITPKAPSTARPSDFAFNDVGVKHFSVSVLSLIHIDVYKRQTAKGAGARCT